MNDLSRNIVTSTAPSRDENVGRHHRGIVRIVNVSIVYLTIKTTFRLLNEEPAKLNRDVALRAV
jgi:hypothetical protein